MSYYTREQKRVMGYLAMANVHYHKNMWSRSRQLGYTHKSTPLDEIHIASDLDSEVKKVVLLHEVGHVYFNHNSVDVKAEMKAVKEIFDKYGIPYIKGILHFGGPNRFLNICMDLEVNSKLLTLANVKTMLDNNFKILTQKSMDVPTLDGFRDYYEVLISQLKDKIEERRQQREQEKQNGQTGESDDSEDEDEGEGSSSNGSKDSDKEGKGSSSSCGDDDFEDSEDEDSSSDEDGDSSSDDDEDSDGSNGGFGEFDDLDSFLDDIPEVDFPNGMDDLNSDVSATDGDIDEEISKALREENYENPHDETPETQKSVEESLNSEDDGHEVDEPKNYSNFGSWRTLEIKPNTDKEIAKFFSQIVDNSLNTRINHVKHWNRGTRRDPSGLLYSSVSMTIGHKNPKVGILIDVSGSMETQSVLRACNSLTAVSRYMAPDSLIVTWSIHKEAEFDFRHIPQYVEAGGGTSLLNGMRYLVEEKKCDVVVIYSDFYTGDSELLEMTKMAKKKGTKVYSIDVVTDRIYGDRVSLPVNEDIWKDWIKLNKDVLRVV